MASGSRRWLRILAVLAIILIIGVVILDRVGVVVAETQVAKQARAQLASENVTTSGNPSVTIDGFPFLTQVLSGHYDKINIVLPHPTSQGVQLDSLAVTATNVNAPARTVINGGGQVTAALVIGKAHISWTAFEEMVDLTSLKQYGLDLAQLKISSTDAGQITLSAPITMLGQTFTAVAVGALTVHQNLVHVTISKVDALGSEVSAVVAAQLQALASQMTFDTRIPDLPYHLVVTDVQTVAGGVEVTASAKNVTLAS